jgi:DMSO/TMAO reductase YedYZ molybdopterin-dependent catalytic subunit
MSDLSQRQVRRSGRGAESGAVRFTRRWFVLAAAGIVAGLAGLAEVLRRGGTSLKGAVTAPESLFGSFPVRSVERQPPTEPPRDWVVTVDGLVERPQTIDNATWLKLERVDEKVDFHCVEGWSVDDVRWGGVAPSVLLDLAGVLPQATHVTFYAAGGAYKDGLPLDLVRGPLTVLADRLNDEPLEPAHGGPVRLVVPDQLGYKSVKWVERLEVTDEQVEGYWEKRGYPVDAPVTQRKPRPLT